MRLLVTGAGGLLGGYLLRERQRQGGPLLAWSGSRGGDSFGFPMRPVDLTDRAAIADAFRHDRPAVVLHAAAVARVADCHRDPERAARVNAEAAATLADLAATAKARLVFVSTDLIFDGESAPYGEDAAPNPLSTYARTKRAGELAVLAAPRSAVVRVSLLVGPSINGRPSFFDEQIAALRAGRPLTLFRDEWRTPLDLVTAARALLAAADSDFAGVLHVGGPERLSRLELGMRLAASLGVPSASIVASDRAAAPSPEPRPRDVSLDSSRWRQAFPSMPWPTWDEALRQM